MQGQATELHISAERRERALSRLSGPGTPEDARARTSTALRVLHDLASSASTASDALAMLHELQVHQVELDMQVEELDLARAELEAALDRQVQLYDRAPVGSFTIDRATIVHELNLTGADLLGETRHALLGRPLAEFLAPESGRLLQELLTRIGAGSGRESCSLRLATAGGGAGEVHACLSGDPQSRCVHVALMEIGEPPEKA